MEFTSGLASLNLSAWSLFVTARSTFVAASRSRCPSALALCRPPRLVRREDLSVVPVLFAHASAASSSNFFDGIDPLPLPPPEPQRKERNAEWDFLLSAHFSLRARFPAQRTFSNVPLSDFSGGKIKTFVPPRAQGQGLESLRPTGPEPKRRQGLSGADRVSASWE